MASFQIVFKNTKKVDGKLISEPVIYAENHQSLLVLLYLIIQFIKNT